MKRHPIVSDHAVLRYLERVQGIDLGFVREEISRTVAAAVAAGARNIAVGGFVYILMDGVVTTIIAAESAAQARAGGKLKKGRCVRMQDQSRRRGRPEIELDEEAVD